MFLEGQPFFLGLRHFEVLESLSLYIFAQSATLSVAAGEPSFSEARVFIFKQIRAQESTCYAFIDRAVRRQSILRWHRLGKKMGAAAAFAFLHANCPKFAH